MDTNRIFQAIETLEAAEEMYNAVADEGRDYDDRCWPPSECIQFAQAAALIALAERPQFVQISHHRIRADAIVEIEDFGEGVNVWIANGPCAQLYGEDKAKFLLWHDQHADVERI